MLSVRGVRRTSEFDLWSLYFGLGAWALKVQSSIAKKGQRTKIKDQRPKSISFLSHKNSLNKPCLVTQIAIDAIKNLQG